MALQTNPVMSASISESIMSCGWVKWMYVCGVAEEEKVGGRKEAEQRHLYPIFGDCL